MPDLLLELRSEEIPACMQRNAAGSLRKMLTDALVDAGLTYEGAQEYWTPRRLALDVRGVSARSRDVREDIKGPSVKAPEAAIQGFLRKAGLASIAEAHVHADPKKGDFYVAHKVTPGRAAEEVIAEAVPRIVREFPWPKSMRWGAASAKPGALRWVRPLQSILCTFGPETEDPVVVEFAVDGIRSGNTTVGHRFHAPGTFPVKRFDDYAAKLEAAHVVLSAERRKSIIRTDAENLAFASGLELVTDEGLLEEVSGLVEWPVVLMGEFEDAFLEIPAEVIRLTIRANQKCFVTRGGEGEQLAPRFLLTANIEARDGGAEIARGNAKVVRARLSDALYFWRTDQNDLPDLSALEASAQKFGLNLSKPLDQRMARLDHLNVTFHAKLGTQGERVERIRRLARELAPLVGADPDLADRAAVLAKADLQTEVVGEFPELQGLIGRKYALLQGEHPSVAAAIEEHWKPQGPSDFVPTDPVSIAVALADKLDTLVGFWAIDEKPTGSKDPYALRRAALGVIRLILENAISLSLEDAVAGAATAALGAYAASGDVAPLGPVAMLDRQIQESFGTSRILQEAEHVSSLMQGGMGQAWQRVLGSNDEESEFFDGQRLMEMGEVLRPLRLDIASFFHDRLKVYLRDQGARHDLIDAVLAAGSTSPLWGGGSEAAGGGSDVSAATPTPSLRADGPPHGSGRSTLQEPHQVAPGRPSAVASHPHKGEGNAPANDDLLSIVRRVEALGKLLDTEDGKNLLAGTKRAVNILAAEEKKGTGIAQTIDPALFRDEAEKNLFDAVNGAEKQAGQAIKAEDFSAAMVALSALREPIDRFFEHVMVNDEDAAVRGNRLALLSRIRAATGQVADFTRIAG